MRLMSDVTAKSRSLCVSVRLFWTEGGGVNMVWSGLDHPVQSGPGHMVQCVSSTAAAAVLLLMSSGCVQGLRVDVSPRAPLLRLGQRHQLVCRVQGCPLAPILSWSLLEDRPLTARVSSNGTHSLLTFDPVLLEDEGALVCRVSCGGESRQSKVQVQVYCELHTHTHGPVTPPPRSREGVVT